MDLTLAIDLGGAKKKLEKKKRKMGIVVIFLFLTIRRA
jgi:hypothetical protein